MIKPMNQRGFSFIEIMIALLIFFLLAAIAYPSYTHFLLKSHRSDALTALKQTQTSLEYCYAQHFSYKKECNLLPSLVHTSPQGFYRIELTHLEEKTYILSAIPIGSQKKDTLCTIMTVNQANLKTAADSSGTAQALCWNPL